eukprot:1178029-Prorocentrum_minimum.AAC.5
MLLNDPWRARLESATRAAVSERSHIERLGGRCGGITVAFVETSRAPPYPVDSRSKAFDLV